MDLKSFLKTLKLQESTISMIIGVIVILIVGFLAIRYFGQRNTTPETLPPVETTNENKLPTTHTVKTGETLWSIAEEYYGTGYNWVDIKESNNLKNADEIREGQELTIPDATPRVLEANKDGGSITVTPEVTPIAKVSPTPEQVESPKENASESTYTVSKNDSLWKIAKAKLGDGKKWTELAKKNNLKNPSVIYAGQELKLTGNQEGSITPEAASTSATSYTVVKGDSLWTIAQGTYGNGDQWVKIAKANNLAHPSLIHPGNSLTIPE